MNPVHLNTPRMMCSDPMRLLLVLNRRPLLRHQSPWSHGRRLATQILCRFFVLHATRSLGRDPVKRLLTIICGPQLARQLWHPVLPSAHLLLSRCHRRVAYRAQDFISTIQVSSAEQEALGIPRGDVIDILAAAPPNPSIPPPSRGQKRPAASPPNSPSRRANKENEWNPASNPSSDSRTPRPTKIRKLILKLPPPPDPQKNSRV
ncbi:hypothetical protein B0H10DRAFT_2004798 [Mycena sp. CBHHK59/15]|nr:hypothetical protein B0H10DRAFT_2151462 [Mycena sp. CBHHK59/15]KAJ6624912.1 hypothetical protein B0H10DRAFT_2004798 [Mycena sp. CBHHK59/15]